MFEGVTTHDGGLTPPVRPFKFWWVRHSRTHSPNKDQLEQGSVVKELKGPLARSGKEQSDGPTHNAWTAERARISLHNPKGLRNRPRRSAEVTPLENSNDPVREVEFAPGYIITSDGLCFNTRRSVRRILKSAPDVHGYLVFKISAGDRLKKYKVHQLVAHHFIGPRPEGLQTHHVDGNKNNNAASNLAYGTAQQNADDKKRHDAERGIIYKVRNFARGAGQVFGERNPSAKLTEVDVIEARNKYRNGTSCFRLCDIYPVGINTMYSMLTGQTWKHIPGAVRKHSAEGV